MSKLLQDAFIDTLCKEKANVSIFLANGIKLEGKISSFDQYVIFLKSHHTQMIYKHAIATVVPEQSIHFSNES